MIKTSDEGTSYCPQCEAYARRIDELELTNECLMALFKSAMSDDSNTGKVVRLQQAWQKIEFMNESEANRQIVMGQFRAWKQALRELGRGEP